MSRSVDLPDTVYAALEEAASTSGTTPAEWIAARLPQPAPAAEPECDGEPARTHADEFAGRVGAVSSGRSDLSERVKEVYADHVVAKHRTRQMYSGAETTSSGTLELPEPVYLAIAKAASALGTTPADWIAANLPLPATSISPECEGSPPKTLAERLVGRVGVFHSRRGDLSERHSELFTEGLVEKRRLGNL